MDHRQFITFLNTIEKLKCNTRHSWTSSGRRESVAEHSWRLSVMALLCADEYPDLDIDKVVKMSIIHDLGEAITGDVPSFVKTDENEKEEEDAISTLLSMLPQVIADDFSQCFQEMKELQTPESKLFKALDNMETLISHNEADISTWLPLEYTENLVYGQKNVQWSEWTKELKEVIKEDSIKKMKNAAN